MRTPTQRPPVRCAPEGEIAVDFGRHRLTPDGRLELEGLAHAYMARWLALVEEDLVPPPPGYPASAQFYLTATHFRLPVLPADAPDVLRVLDAFFDRPGIVAPARRFRDKTAGGEPTP